MEQGVENAYNSSGISNTSIFTNMEKKYLVVYASVSNWIPKIIIQIWENSSLLYTEYEVLRNASQDAFKYGVLLEESNGFVVYPPHVINYLGSIYTDFNLRLHELYSLKQITEGKQ